MKTACKDVRSHCSVNYGLEIFGDKWSLLIVRDIVFAGKKTYGEFLKSEEGFATNVLASRLAFLEEQGILSKTPSSADRRKDFYALTEKGLDLIPILLKHRPLEREARSEVVHATTQGVRCSPESKRPKGERRGEGAGPQRRVYISSGQRMSKTAAARSA